MKAVDGIKTQKEAKTLMEIIPDEMKDFFKKFKDFVDSSKNKTTLFNKFAELQEKLKLN